MNLLVNLPQELEYALKNQAIASGEDMEAIVLEILEQAFFDPQPGAVEKSPSHEQFREKLQRFIDLHSRGNAETDDSRESMYAG